MGFLSKIIGRGEPAAQHAVVVWKPEDSMKDGEPVGSVFIDYYSNAATRSESVTWNKLSSRAKAQDFADDHGYAFHADE